MLWETEQPPNLVEPCTKHREYRQLWNTPEVRYDEVRLGFGVSLGMLLRAASLPQLTFKPRGGYRILPAVVHCGQQERQRKSMLSAKCLSSPLSLGYLGQNRLGRILPSCMSASFLLLWVLKSRIRGSDCSRTGMPAAELGPRVECQVEFLPHPTLATSNNIPRLEWSTKREPSARGGLQKFI